MSNKKEVKEKIVSQSDVADNRIKELEAQLEASKVASANDQLKERIAHLEGKLAKEKSNEDLYIERKAKYEANIKKKREKEAKVAKALADIEGEE